MSKIYRGIMVIVKYSEGKVKDVLDKTAEEIEEELKKKESEEENEEDLNKKAEMQNLCPPFWAK